MTDVPFADMTIEQKTAYRDDLQRAADNLAAGRGVQRVQYNEFGRSYHNSDLPALQKRIDSLTREIDRASGVRRSRGGFIPVVR